MSARSEELQCEWDGWQAIDRHQLRLDLAEGNYCDMTEAIALAQRLLPEVAIVQTYCGGKPDTRYERNGGGEWKAYDADGRRWT